MADEFMTEEQMEAVANGTAFMQQEEIIEEETIEPEEAEEAEEIDESEPESDVEEEPKRSSMIPRNRFDEVNERARQADARAQELEYKLNQQTEAFNKLMAKLSGESSDASEDDDEILDTALEKKVEGKFSKIEERDFERTKAQEIAYLGANSGEVYEKAVAAIAIEVMENEQGYGRNLDIAQAESLARQIADKQMRTMYAENAKPGAIARALSRKAQQLDYMLSQNDNTKQPLPKKVNGVNMKSVEKARQQAGAPSIEKEAVTMQPNNIVASEIKKAREAGYSDDYLSQFGF